ncbi:MAG: NUDIX hydrolase [Steroidobacteraceae bacterium]
MLISRRTHFTGRVVRVDVDEVRLPNGHEATLEVVHHPGGAAAVAIDADRRVCLLRQYRHAIGQWIVELPAGKLDTDEGPEATAQRELAEEAGVTARTWQSLGCSISSPGVFTEFVHLFLATELGSASLQREHGEVLEPFWMPLDEALQNVLDGHWSDAKTVVGLVRAAALLRRGDL